jgi:hypothetical protein
MGVGVEGLGRRVPMGTGYRASGHGMGMARQPRSSRFISQANHNRPAIPADMAILLQRIWDRNGPDYAVPHVSDTARVSDGVNGRAEIGPVGRGREMQGKNKWAEAGNLAHDVGKSPFITFFYIICIFILNSNSNLVLDFKFN